MQDIGQNLIPSECQTSLIKPEALIVVCDRHGRVEPLLILAQDDMQDIGQNLIPSECQTSLIKPEASIVVCDRHGRVASLLL